MHSTKKTFESCKKNGQADLWEGQDPYHKHSNEIHGSRRLTFLYRGLWQDAKSKSLKANFMRG